MFLVVLIASAANLPIPPIEVAKPKGQEESGLILESFQFEIDQKEFDCSAGELGTGVRAPHVYNVHAYALSGELQVHAARCKATF